MKFIDTFDHHRKNSDQSLDDYYRLLQKELFESIQNKKIVYLDTNFWIHLRDANLFPEKNELANEFLELSLSLVQSNKSVFPISDSIFMEIFKQTDPTSLKESVSLIDKLSQGVSIIDFFERIRLELISFFVSDSKKKLVVIDELIWTKIPYVIGFHSFNLHEYDEVTLLALQKTWMDQLWNVSMLESMETLIDKGSLGKIKDSNNTDKFNEGKFSHQNQATSYFEMFMNEIGAIDAYDKELEDVSNILSGRVQRKLLTAIEKYQQKEDVQIMIKKVISIFREEKGTLLFPTFNVNASLHAAVRWDKNQRYQEHDILDFKHASAALPYCDYFFTEKRLAHMITQKMLALDNRYECNVQSNLKSAIAELKKLL